MMPSGWPDCYATAVFSAHAGHTPAREWPKLRNWTPAPRSNGPYCPISAIGQRQPGRLGRMGADIRTNFLRVLTRSIHEKPAGAEFGRHAQRFAPFCPYGRRRNGRVTHTSEFAPSATFVNRPG